MDYALCIMRYACQVFFGLLLARANRESTSIQGHLRGRWVNPIPSPRRGRGRRTRRYPVYPWIRAIHPVCFPNIHTPAILRNSHPRRSCRRPLIVMMQSADFRDRDYRALVGWQHWTRVGAIHREREMRAPPMVVVLPDTKHPSQMLLPEGNQEAHALAASGAEEPFTIGGRRWGVARRPENPDPQRGAGGGEPGRIEAVPLGEDEPRAVRCREAFPELRWGPDGDRGRRGAAVEQATAPHLEGNKDVQDAAPRGPHDAAVARHQGLGVRPDKGAQRWPVARRCQHRPTSDPPLAGKGTLLTGFDRPEERRFRDPPLLSS
jgi:hypothetical protein